MSIDNEEMEMEMSDADMILVDLLDMDDFDEHEYEIRSKVGSMVRWRRIEALQEQRRLKEQLTDFDDYVC